MSNWEWLLMFLGLYGLGATVSVILMNAHINDWEGWRQPPKETPTKPINS